MTLSGLLLFAAAYGLAVASPGPGVAAIVARVLARGTHGLAAFIAGFVAGDLVWFVCAAAGLALLAQQFHLLFLVVKYAGAAWLLWLAWSLWTAPPQAPPQRAADAPAEKGGRLFLAGLALTLGNPKVMAFFLAILPTVVDLPRLSLVGGLELAAAMAAILATVLSGYAFAAAQARRMIASPRAVRLINRASGAALAGAAAAVASR